MARDFLTVLGVSIGSDLLLGLDFVDPPKVIPFHSSLSFKTMEAFRCLTS